MAITGNRADQFDARLRELGLEPEDFRDWIMRRIYAADESGRRITHYRRVRGSHGESYVWDPDGTDELPLGYETPKPPLAAAS